MQIVHDRSYITQTEQEFISRGYACESFYSLRFSFVYTEEQQAENRAYADVVGLDGGAWNAHVAAGALRRSEHMERIAAVMARNFKVYQYDGHEEVPYKSDWDLFFWCNDFTLRELPAGRDYGYFTLSFNSEHGLERRRKIYDRTMCILESFSDDGNLHVAVQYTAVMDDAKIRRAAELAASAIAGRNCVYNNMEGRIEANGADLYFRKKRCRKHVYCLTARDILSISWRLSA